MFEFPPKSETDQSVPSMNLPVPIVAVASWIETRRRNASRDPPADGWSDQREPRILDCNVLTMQSKILGSRWSLHPSAGGSLEAFLLRVSIQDATATMGTGKFIDGTDWSVSDLGGNSNIQFTPKSSVVDPQS